MTGKGLRNTDGTDESKYGGGKKRKKGVGTQLDLMKRVRKNMPPTTRVMKEKNRPKPSTNWRDLLEDEDDWCGNDIDFDIEGGS